MIESLVFMMGEYRAEFPGDRHYARNHMWAQKQPTGVWRFGFSAYAVRLLQDVYFLEWNIEAPCGITTGAEMGSIESKKAESSLYAPLQGRLVEFNHDLMHDPSSINVDKYGKGWLFEIEAVDASVLLSPKDYVAHLSEVWEKTQRTIKGQMNE